MLFAQTQEISKVNEVLRSYLNSLIEAAPSIVIAIVVFLLFLIAANFGRGFAIRMSDRVTDDESLKSLFGTLSRVAIIVVGLFCAASILFPGLQAGHLVGVLGLSSVAVGFAFKDIFQNFLAGVLILAQRPFQFGDQIIVTDFEGTVEDITIRSTLLKTYDGERVIIPNAHIYSSPVQVRTAHDVRRTRFSTGIGYDEDIDRGREVIMEALASCSEILQEPAPQVVVTEHGDSSVNFEVRFWTDSKIGNIVAARDEVATRVKNALDEADIEIPYPYRTVEFFDLTSDE